MTTTQAKLPAAPAEQTDRAAALGAAIRDRTARMAVVGMGYVGLPMAMEFVRAGFSVVGFDVDADRCAALAGGQSYIGDVTDADLAAALESAAFRPCADPAVLAEADAILICVPTPLRKTKDPDLGPVIAAGESVARFLRRGQLIVLESTTYPGTTEEVLLPMLEATGLTVGDDFYLAFSPERVDPGNAQYGVKSITKLVGGVSPACTKLATELYRQAVTTVMPVSGTRVAEAAKLLENTFRSVNIGLVNEMALVCRHLGVDVWEVIDAAATKPFGFMPHYPGPGIGGHCIPLDPHYLSWKARLSGYEPRLIGLASEINSAMPQYVVDLITRSLNDHCRCVRGSRILILGVAYKPNVGDVRESPSLEIIRLLRERGARLSYCDPYVPDLASEGLPLTARSLAPNVVRENHCTVIVTHHSAFDYEMVVQQSPLVIDTRNATRPFAHRGTVRFL